MAATGGVPRAQKCAEKSAAPLLKFGAVGRAAWLRPREKQTGCGNSERPPPSTPLDSYHDATAEPAG